MMLSSKYLRWSRAKLTAPAPAKFPGSVRLRLRNPACLSVLSLSFVILYTFLSFLCTIDLPPLVPVTIFYKTRNGFRQLLPSRSLSMRFRTLRARSLSFAPSAEKVAILYGKKILYLKLRYIQKKLFARFVQLSVLLYRSGYFSLFENYSIYCNLILKVGAAPM